MSETDQIEDMEFIMDIMQARETIQDAGPEDRAAIEALVEENQSACFPYSRWKSSLIISAVRMNKTIKELESLTENKNWADLKAAAIRLRYLEGIERAAKQYIDGL